MITMSHRIRYSETDLTGHLSMQGLLRLFQDLNYLGAEDADRGIDYQAAHGAAWYLLSWDVHMCRAPRLSETVTFTSYFYQMTGALAKKYMSLTNGEGEVLAYALTRWAFVDIKSGEPLPFPKDYWTGEDTDTLPTGIAPTCRIPTTTDTVLSPFVVTEAMIDENGHVNNVLFSEAALSLAGHAVGCTHLRAEFLRQTRGGDVLTPHIGTQDRMTVLRYLGCDGKPNACFACQ